MKTSELAGAQLDYWVVRALMEPFKGRPLNDQTKEDIVKAFGLHADVPFLPSTEWAHGGPIIEREGISPMRWEASNDDGTAWTARNLTATVHQSGPTALIAAMRAYVVSKFGDDVPDLR